MADVSTSECVTVVFVTPSRRGTAEAVPYVHVTYPPHLPHPTLPTCAYPTC